MKVTLLQENLLPKLSNVSRVASGRGSLPVLENVLVSASKGKVTLSATDLETSITTWVGAKVEEEGALTVPAKVFQPLINSLEGEKITMHTDKDSLIIESGEVRSRIAGISAKEFPQLPKFSDTFLKIDSTDLKNSLSSVLFAAAQDEGRPILTGVLFKLADKNLVLVGVDGFRLSEKRLVIEKNVQQYETVVPSRSLSEVARLAGGTDEILVDFQKENGQILFGTEDFVLSSRILDGEFPNYEQIIPTNFAIEVGVLREDLLHGVQLASIFSNKGTGIVELSIDPSSKIIILKSEEQEWGQARKEISCQAQGDSVKIAFNARYLQDALNVLRQEKIKLFLNGGLDPALFRDGDDLSFLHVIMPVRLQA